MSLQRTQAGFDEFVGKCDKVEIVESDEVETDDGQPVRQVAITISTDATKTGKMYTWVKISETTTEDATPQDSAIDKYVQAIEEVHTSECKKLTKWFDMFKLLEGNTYKWKRKIIGKGFEGKKPKEAWIPVKEMPAGSKSK